MKIVMLTANDPAGMGIRFARAINKHTDHLCRLISTEQRYGIDFGKDIHLPDLLEKDMAEVEHVLADADIFHFHMLADETMMIGPLCVNDYIKGKKIIHHHHGHPIFRNNPKVFFDKYTKLQRKYIVSTPDLLKILPGSVWVPNVVPVYDHLYLPLSIMDNNIIVIGQSPTRKDLKNSEELIKSVEKVKEKTLCRIELRSFEYMQHEQCLIEKRKCHIIFDHMQGYFGVSSLESLSQGKPVIAGLDEWNIRCIKEFTGKSELPWQLAFDMDSLARRLAILVDDEPLRSWIGSRSRKFMTDCWQETDVLRILMDVYAGL